MSPRTFNEVIGSDDIASQIAAEFGLSKSAAQDVGLLVESFESIIDSEELSDEEAVSAAEVSASEYAQITKGRNAAPIAAKTWDTVRARRKRPQRIKVTSAVGNPAAQVSGKPGKELTMTKITKVTKSTVMKMMTDVANLEKRKDETPAAAFARYLESAEGAEGYRVYKSMPDDEPAIAKAAAPASRDTELPAFQAIKKRAGELQRAFPKLSDAAAFAKVYEDPSSAALRDAYKRERASIAA